MQLECAELINEKVKANDLNVGGTALMWEVERLDEVALLTNELIERVDVRDVVREGNDTDTRRVRVNIKTGRQSASKVHDQLVLGLNAARQVQNHYQVHH